MTYAKLIDGNLRLAPNPILVGGNYIGNPPASVYEAEGYKPLVYTDPPTVEPGYIAVPDWQEEDNEIVQVWHIEEEPDEVDADRALEILFGGEE
jgi:hypothetical protein